MALTEGQKKLPPALQKAILAKQAKDAKTPKKPMPKPPMKDKGKKY